MYETVGDEERVIASEVEAYVVADFLPPVDVRFTAVNAPADSVRELELDEVWIFRRREEGRA